jgi:hypothetical protein
MARPFTFNPVGQAGWEVVVGRWPAVFVSFMDG